MLRAGALFVAVTISFVIAVLISLLIVLSYHYKIQNLENLLLKKLERNANSSVVLLMEGTENNQETKKIDLYGEESDSVEILIKNWGVFDVAAVRAFSGKYSLTKVVELGYKPDESLSGALYLTDLSRPLNLCGKTTIKGNCFLPEAGVKRGYIEGKSYEGKKLIDGETKQSKNSLPPLSKEVLQQLKNVFGENYTPSGLYREIILDGEDSVIQSFLDTMLLIRLGSSFNLSGKTLSGNVMILCKQSLVIDESSRLEDVLVFARDIKIQKGFTGTIQAFALDSIIVEENCRLKYPSTLGLFKNDHKTQQPFIKIGKKSDITGIVFTSQSELASDLKQTLVALEKEALLKGQLYVEGFADLKGEVRGSVWCNKFLLKTPSSVYENHLLDAIIDNTKLSPHYVGAGLIVSGKKKKIVKWLE